MRTEWKHQPLDERVRMIREAYGDVGASSAVLAERIEAIFGYRISRNTIAGLYNRVKELRRTHPLTGVFITADPTRPPKKRKPSGEKRVKATKAPKPAVKKRITKAAIQKEHAEYDANTLKLSIVDLEARSCKFIINDDAPFLYCGHEAPIGGSYCPHHRRRVYVCKPVKE